MLIDGAWPLDDSENDTFTFLVTLWLGMGIVNPVSVFWSLVIPLTLQFIVKEERMDITLKNKGSLFASWTSIESFKCRKSSL